VEHVERQEERERELSGQVDQLEDQGDQLENEGDRLDEQIDRVREEFERKKQAPEVPGAQDPEDDPSPRTEEDE
jgi:chaperonin cofactor prefoldin